MRTAKRTWKTHEGERPAAVHRGGTPRSSDEVPDNGMERRGGGVEPDAMSQPAMGGADEGGTAVWYFQVRPLGVSEVQEAAWS